MSLKRSTVKTDWREQAIKPTLKKRGGGVRKRELKSRRMENKEDCDAKLNAKCYKGRMGGLYSFLSAWVRAPVACN